MTLLLSMVLSVMAICTGCDREPGACPNLQPGPVPVRIEFDWHLDPGATPESMTIYLYKEDKKGSLTPLIYDFDSHRGDEIKLTPGTYAAIAHNSDSDRHGYVGLNEYEQFGLKLSTTRNVSTSGLLPGSGSKTDGERIAHTPDEMWVCALSRVIIERPADGSVQTITFEMHPTIFTYSFLVRDPVNYTQGLSVTGSISGMAGTIHPGRGLTGTETVTHLITMTGTPEGHLAGRIQTFGHCSERPLRSETQSGELSHILTLYVTTPGGKAWSNQYDVTDQIHDSQDPDCRVILDNVEFPTISDEGTGGFSPSVGLWQGNQEHIGM